MQFLLQLFVILGRKRTRVSDSNSEELARMAISNQNAPSMTTTSEAVLPNTNAPLPSTSSNNSEQNSNLSQDLLELLEEKCPSTEFRAFMNNMNSDEFLPRKYYARTIVL